MTLMRPLALIYLFSFSLVACSESDGGGGGRSSNKDNTDGSVSSRAVDASDRADGGVSVEDELCARARDNLYEEPCSSPLSRERYCGLFESIKMVPGCPSVVEEYHRCTAESMSRCCGTISSDGQCVDPEDGISLLLPTDCVSIFDDSPQCFPNLSVDGGLFPGLDGGIFDLDVGPLPDGGGFPPGADTGLPPADPCTQAIDNLFSIECPSSISREEFTQALCAPIPGCSSQLNAALICIANSDIVCQSSEEQTIPVPVDCDAELDAVASCEEG